MNINHLSIGMKAPDFTATTTMGTVNMCDYTGHWLIFFSHPGDFTPVCTTEFIAFANAYDDFCKLNTRLLGLSIDSNPSHLAWVHDIYTITGVQIPFPIVADRSADVARLYGMIAPNVSNTETVRNVYFIDPDQIIRAILVYPLTNGRCIPEIIRLLMALQTSDCDNVVTPANWSPGKAAMVPAAKTYSELLTRESSPDQLGLSCKDWFWCYKNPESQSPKQPVNARRRR